MTTESQTARIPRVMWAQRKENVFVTIELVEAHEEKYEINEKQLTFAATQESTGEKYAATLDFYADIVPEETEKQISPRQVFFNLKKKDVEASYWPRLLKSGKPHYVHTDFGRWKDEEESDEEAMAGMGGMGGMPGMGGMGGFPGMEGMGGFPGMEGMDFSKLASQMGAEGEVSSDDEDPYQKSKSKDAASDDE